MRSAFCTVENVRLHYIDWGGTGPAMLLLPGLGFTAHIYSDLAPHLTDRFRVLALTRRGHGQSDKPEADYSIETLTADLSGFMAALNLERATLAGHSFAGDELTAFATRYPEQVERLIYLDAAYDYAALYSGELRVPAVFSSPPQARVSLAAYRTWLQQQIYGFWSAAQEADLQAQTRLEADGSVGFAMPQAVSQAVSQMRWQRDYSQLRAPALAIYAGQAQHYLQLLAPLGAVVLAEVRSYFSDFHTPWMQRSMDQFRQQAGGQIVELPATQHLCFVHRQEAVVQAMRAFLEL